MKNRLILIFLLIGVMLFCACPALANELTLPAGLREIRDEAFMGDRSLDEVNLPDGTVSIGARAFAQTSLKRIYLPTTVKEIAPDAFSGSTSVTAWGFPGCYAEEYCNAHGIPFEAKTTPLSEFTFEFINDEEARLTGWNGTGDIVVIPRMADADHEITSIADRVFKEKTALKYVSMPETVRTIGEEAFLGCTGLTVVTLPENLEEIYRDAFRYCTGLKDVVFNQSLFHIARGAFCGCTSLIEADLPDSVKQLGEGSYIGAGVFEGCTSLVRFHHPLNLRTVSGAMPSVFEGCEKLTEIDFPENLEAVSERIFMNLSCLTEVNIPDTVYQIGTDAFYGCTGLTQIDLPEDLEEIGLDAFRNCTNLKDVIFHDGLLHIYRGAFAGCTSLIEADLPDTVKQLGEGSYIGAGVFEGCSALTTFYYPLDLESVSGAMSGVFKNCPNFKTVIFPDLMDNICGNIFENAASLEEIDIPDSVYKIGGMAFYGCTGLTVIDLPEDLEELGVDAFKNCTGLKDVIFHENLFHICRGAFSGCKALEDADLPDSVEQIGEGSYIGDAIFENCTSLVTFHYPLNLQTVSGASGVFKNNPKFTEVTVPDSVTSIPANLFRNADALEIVHMPDGITTIGGSAFEFCTALKEITLPAELEELGGSAFEGCTALKTVNFNQKLKYIYDSAFLNCKSLEAADLPDSVEKMGSFNGVFRNNEVLSYFHYPKNLKSVAYYFSGTFTGCRKLTEITIPEGVTTLAPYIFRDADKLKTVNLPDSLETIGHNAFEGAVSLTTVNFGYGPLKIEDNAFARCESLREMTLPNVLTTICDSVWRNCTSLRRIYIPASVTSIGNNVFENCPRTLEIWCEYNSLALQYAINNDHKYYYLTPVGVNLPFSRIYRGDPFTLYGTIYSSINISEVTATLSSGDQSTVIAQKTVNPAATSYPLSGDFSSAFNFPALALGTYHFQLYAKTSKSTEIYMDGDFQVVPPPLRVSLSGFTPPSGAVNRLSAGPITGTLSANYPLTSVRITIYDANGAATGQAYSGSPNTASFSLAASGIDLSQLADGAYRFLFTASGNGETRTVADTYFELGDFGHYAGTVDAIREFVNNKNKSEAVFGYDHSMEYKGKLAQDPNYKYKEFLNKYVVNFDQTLTNEINNFITYSYNMILSGSYVKDDQAIIDAYKLSLSAYIQSVSGYSPAHLLEADKTLVEKVIESVYQYGKINYDYISEASQATGEKIDSFTRRLGTLLSVYEKLDGANEKLKNKQYAEAVGSLVEYYAEGRRVLEALKTQYTAASSNERYQFGRAVDEMLKDFDGSMNSEVDKMINEISKKAAKKVEKAMEDFIKGVSLELHYTLRLVEFTVVTINEYTGFLDCVDKANQYIMECNIYTQIAGTYGETLRKVRAGDYSQETLDKLCVTFEAAKSYALKLCDILYALDSEFYASTGDNTRKLQYLRHAFLPT